MQTVKGMSYSGVWKAEPQEREGKKIVKVRLRKLQISWQKGKEESGLKANSLPNVKEQ